MSICNNLFDNFSEKVQVIKMLSESSNKIIYFPIFVIENVTLPNSKKNHLRSDTLTQPILPNYASIQGRQIQKIAEKYIFQKK